MGYKKTDPCLQKAFDDERLFVLMTRDNTSPEVVCEWIKLNIRNQPFEKLKEALKCALEMVDRQREFEFRKQGWLPIGGHDYIPNGSKLEIISGLDTPEITCFFDGQWPEGAKYYKILETPLTDDDLPF